MPRVRKPALIAGRNLGVAFEVLAERYNLTIDEIVTGDDWSHPIHGRGLSKTPDTVREWTRSGVPDEREKVALVAGYIGVSTEFLRNADAESFRRELEHRLDKTGTFGRRKLTAFELRAAAKVWLRQHYSIAVVKQFARDKALADSSKVAAPDMASAALVLLVSVYKGENWAEHIRINHDNEHAVEGLVAALVEPIWWRVRFRCLFGLQFVDSSMLEEVVSRYSHLTTDMMGVLRTHVRRNSVLRYLTQVGQSAESDVSASARAVLKEIRLYWRIQIPED